MARMAAERCDNCKKFKHAWDVKYDRHHHILCSECAEKLQWCSTCGSSLFWDDGPDGQLHYDGSGLRHSEDY